MEEQLRLLTEQVQKLQADNERLRASEANATSGSAGTNESSQQASTSTDTRNSGTDRYVFLPRERKCPRFSGKSSDTLTVEDWVEEMRRSLESRHMSTAEKALFIYDHLDGEAKTEMKFRPEADRKDHDKILKILLEIYGCSHSYIGLQKQFFQRRQLEGESLREFSHSLLSLMEVVNRRSPTAISNSDQLVRDQFVDNVRDSMLRRELKRSLRITPNASFLEIRSEAIRWVEEGEHVGAPRARAYSCNTQAEARGECNVDSQTVVTKPPTDWLEVKETLSKQQAQLDLLLKHFSLTNTQPQPTPAATSQPARTYRYDPSGKPICSKCNQVGHIARFCRNGRGSGSTASVAGTHAPQGSVGANTAETQGN